MLGPLNVSYDGRPVELRRVKERTLLGLLVLHADRVVSRDHLVRGLWDQADTAHPDSTLRVHVSRLRAALITEGCDPGGLITASGAGYRLCVADDAVDVRQFERLASDGRYQLASGDASVAASTLAAAAELWRGPILADAPVSSAVEPELARLEELRMAVMEDQVEAGLACGRHQEEAARLESLVIEHPFRERFWEQRMIALYRCGRQADALRTYEQVRVLLRDELGIRPGPALQQLETRILDQDPSLGHLVGAGRRPTQAPWTSFPAQLTSFVGRAEECREVERLLDDHRLVTLTGIGGVGKTRLSLQVGASRAGIEQDGVWFVALDGVSDPAGVAASVATVTGALEHDSDDPTAAAVKLLRSKSLLLMLDNCEHLLDACSAIVAEILASCPDVRILATSRERLGIGGERAWPVPALRLDSDATRLFVDRAGMARTGLVVDDGLLADAAEICERVDGLPLAIELAAGWMRLLTSAEILARLDDRLTLLQSTGRGVPARQQTLRQLLDWSYGLLDRDEQVLFGRVAVFRGGFSLEAVESLGDATLARERVLPLLAELVDKSLVAVDRVSSGVSRYRLLETVREFAWDQFDDAERLEMHKRHLRWCAERVAATAARLTGPDQLYAFETLEADHDNFRGALTWSATSDCGTGLLLAVGLAPFWQVHGHLDEGRRWLDLLIGLSHDVPVEIRARARYWSGTFAWARGETAIAQRDLAASLMLWGQAGKPLGRAETLLALAEGYSAQGDLGEARPFYEEARVLAGNHGALLIRALKGLGIMARAVGDWEAAASLFEECLQLPGASDDLRIRGQVLNNLAVIRLGQHDPAGAAALLEESLQVKRALRDRPGMAVTLINLGAVACEQGRLDDAEVSYREALDLHDRLGNERGVAYALQGLGEAGASRGDYETAARLLGSAEMTRERIGVVLSPSEERDVERFVTMARAGVGEEAFRQAWQAGRTTGRRPALTVDAPR